MTIRETRVGLDEWPAAVERTDGYQIVVAGPGTGKTEFLVARVGHILSAGKARPSEMAVLCFSRRASAALKKRVIEASGNLGAAVDVATFHSLALRLTEKLAGESSPSPLTTPEQVAFVAGVLAEEQEQDWPVAYRGVLATAPFASEVADFLMRCSERLLSPDDLAERASKRSDWRGLPGLFRRYLEQLGAAGRTDYGVLLARTVESLAENPKIASGYRYVLVDEYQDTTPAQAEMARLLAIAHGNLTVAGDPYQSIYSFRGSDLRNVADFTTTHPEAERVVLTQSLRVPEEILTAALRIVSKGDLPGAAGPVSPAPHPGRVETYIFDQESAEAEWIATEVDKSIVVGGLRPSQVAVLVRSKREGLSELSRALRRRGIPHDPPESRLVDHPAVQVVFDLVAIAVNGGSLPTTTGVEAATADRAMRRMLLGPVFGLGLGRERGLIRARRRTWEPWSRIAAERMPESHGLASLLSETEWATHMPATDGFWHIWTTLDEIDRVVADPARADWRQAWTAFAQTLSRQADRDPSMSLLGYFALTEDDDFEAEPMLTHHLAGDRVVLTTLHQAKGLEFEVVFIANASEGVFPDLRRSRRILRPELLSPERADDSLALFQLQEEMRLAYTAITRARSRVVITATTAGVDQGERRPSRFLMAASGRSLDEIGQPVEEIEDPVTLIEAETLMRRWLLDPSVPAVNRLAATTVLSKGSWWEPNRFAGVSEPGPNSPILGETIRLSPSQAESYSECPRKYALERRLRLGDGSSSYAQFGSLIHKVLERAEKEIVGTGARHAELERALAILDVVWAEADFGTPQLDEAWRGKGVDLITKLYENWPGSGPPSDLEREVITDIEGVSWVGKIDRVEAVGDGSTIVDYKTSTRAVTIDEAKTSIQLGFYAKALIDSGEKVVGAQFWYPRASAKSVTTRNLDLSSLESLSGDIARITRSIRSEDWAPKVGSHCGRCGFKMSCPAWPEGRGAYMP